LATDIVIKLLPVEQGYLLSVQRSFDGASYDVPLLHAPERIGNLREAIRSPLDELRRHVGFDELELNEAETKRAVAHLRRLGFGMLSLLLGGSGGHASDVMEELAKFLAPIFLAKSADARPIIEVEAATADDLAWRIPFEFLPIAPPIEPLYTLRDGFEPFLGFRAETVRLIRAGPTRIERDTNGRVNVHLFANAQMSFRGVLEQRNYLHSNTAVVREWPTGHNVPDAFEGVSQLAKHLLSLAPPAPDKISTIAHFSCHYAAAGPTPGGTYRAAPALNFGALNTTNIDILSLRGEFESQHPRGAPSPFNALFFLNACETAVGGNYENSLLSFFRDRKATAILGSETLLPDPIAGKFAIEFYKGLLHDRLSVGKAVLRARRRLIERYNNPAGLFYTLFGNPLLQAS